MHAAECVLIVDVSFPCKQPALPAELVAAHGGTSAVREGVRTTPPRDVHAGGEQGLHHVKARLCCSRSEVSVNLSLDTHCQYSQSVTHHSTTDTHGCDSVVSDRL